jgi:hypothetical protein
MFPIIFQMRFKFIINYYLIDKLILSYLIVFQNNLNEIFENQFVIKNNNILMQLR